MSDYTNLEYDHLVSYFTRRIKNAWFDPRVKKKIWDGKFKYIDDFGRIPVGLIGRLKAFAKENNYQINIDGYDRLFYKIDDAEFDKWAQEFSKKMEEATGKCPRDYQIDAVKRIIKYRRSISEIATGAGKTLIIYMVFAYLKEHGILDRMLVIVPTTALILQTMDDFIEYSDEKSLLKYKMQTISGESKTKEKLAADIVIGTYQSLRKLPKQWFHGVNCICVDECHTTSAVSVKDILKMCDDSTFRFGLSGTVATDNTAESFTIESYIGPSINKITPKDLFDKKVATPVHIKVLRLRHSNEDVKQKLYDLRQRKAELEGSKQLTLERDLIIASSARFKLICDILKKTTKNTLVLFQNIKDNYGRRIYNELRESAIEKELFYVDGGTDAEVRNRYKNLMEEGENKILIASFGTFSTGISINNLHNILFIESYKSEKIIKQSIGRGMRLHDTKDKVTILDFVDDLSWKGSKNYLLSHGEERLRIYDREQFQYKVYDIEL